MARQRWLPFVASNVFFVVVILLAGCGGGGDSGGGGAATPPPTAQASADEMVPVGTPTTLDGSGSESPTGIPLSYQWKLTEQPSGSTASLSTPNSVRATFTPDVAGTYTAILVVRASGVDSQPDAVSLTAVTGNVAPVANAGPDRSAAPNGMITLDGTASRDPNNSSITYTWRIVEQPPDSHPTLTNATSATPTFTADVAGRYVLALTCSDGSMTSIVDQVVIIVATGNLPPVANAGPDQTVTAGQQVTLDGTGSSDPNGDPLTYSWCLKGRPQGSTATLNGANTARPMFTPDMAGSYVFCLTVNDGKLGSASDSVVVEARLPSSVGGVLQAYVKASNTTVPEFRSFGQSVAFDGDTLAIGASDPSCTTGINGNQTNSSCPGAGAVYVFTRTGDTWSQQAYLKASNTEAHDNFGTRVSLSGDTLAVGVPNEASCASGVNGDQADNGCFQGGAVYVFTRTGSTWSQQAYIKASNSDSVDRNLGSQGDLFGHAVAVSGNTLVVGAHVEESCASGINGNQADNNCPSAGAVYVFTRSNNVWTQEAYLKASNTHIPNPGLFGFNLVLDGDTLAVGAVNEASCATGINGDQTSNSCPGTGAVYVFTRTAGVWTQQAFVKASNISGQFGFGLALEGNTLVVGAPSEASCATGIDGNQADSGCPQSGAVYVFTRTNSLWSQTAYVKAAHPGLQSFAGSFGSNLAFDGTALAVGAGDNNCARGFNPSPGSNDCTASGAVYLFTQTATSWAQRAYVKATNNEAFDFFGSGIAIDGNTLVVGAQYEDSCATGINGNQNDNSCAHPPDFVDTFPPPTHGAGAVYVYALQ
jgi:K319-like protein/FG-GAP repeat protein